MLKMRTYFFNAFFSSFFHSVQKLAEKIKGRDSHFEQKNVINVIIFANQMKIYILKIIKFNLIVMSDNTYLRIFAFTLH